MLRPRQIALQISVMLAGLGFSSAAPGDPAKGAKAEAPRAQAPPPKKGAGGKAEKKKPSSLDLAALQKDLESGDETRTLAALDRISAAEEAQAAPLVDALLVRGANAKVLLQAMDVVRKLAQPASAAALEPYVAHRNPAVRLAAVDALSHTKSPSAAEVLRRALRSADPKLRSAAARGLGTLRAKEAVEDLFAVLPKGVPEAAAPIGMLCSPAECERFMGLIGKLPFDVIESGLEPLFLRPASEVSDDFKLTLVERIRRLATKAATELLERTRTVWPADASPKVKQAIEQALKGRPVTGGTK